LEKEIESLIWDVVENRKRECSEASASEKDLMQLLLEAATNDPSLGKDFSKRFIVDNCKNIYFAGHETTAVSACWCLMFLGLHQEWQSRIRAEVAEHCPNGIPDSESLPLLKTVYPLVCRNHIISLACRNFMKLLALFLHTYNFFELSEHGLSSFQKSKIHFYKY